MKDIGVVILAAGKGTRMKGSTPKALRKLTGKPLIFWTLDLLKKINLINIFTVIGYKSKLVEQEVKKGGYKTVFIKQKKLLGTGDAVKIALKKIPKRIKTILVLFSDDSAFYREKTFKEMIDYYFKKGKPGTMLVVQKKTASSVGGLRRDKRNNVVGIYSFKELLQKNIKKIEVACGVFIFDRKWLETNIKLIKKNPVSGEYLLPQLIYIAAEKRQFLKTFILADPDEWVGINTEEELKEARIKKNLILKHGE